MIYREKLRNKGKILLFLTVCFFCSAQNITVHNKSGFPVEIKYAQKKVEIGINQQKTINENSRVKNILIQYKSDQKQERNISLFLDPKQQLSINLRKDTVQFEGDKDVLHDYVNHHYFENNLTLKITEYQKYNQNNNARGFISLSEMYLGEVLKEVERLNNSQLGREDIFYKEIEKLAKDRWFFTVFVSFDGNHLNNTGKELMLYYFEKYFKKDLASYSCDSGSYYYYIIRNYSLNKKLLNLQLPKYEIVEHSDDDEINQYLPVKCQEHYFRGSYDFWVGKKDLVRAEKYKKILTEKFHAKL